MQRWSGTGLCRLISRVEAYVKISRTGLLCLAIVWTSTLVRAQAPQDPAPRDQQAPAQQPPAQQPQQPPAHPSSPSSSRPRGHHSSPSPAFESAARAAQRGGRPHARRSRLLRRTHRLAAHRPTPIPTRVTQPTSPTSSSCNSPANRKAPPEWKSASPPDCTTASTFPTSSPSRAAPPPRPTIW